MSGRPRGRPRKDASAPPKIPKRERQDSEEAEEVVADIVVGRRSSPRKRKAVNFDGFVVETPGGVVIGEGADVINEIEDEDDSDSEGIVKEEKDDDNYKPGAPLGSSSVKRRSKAAVKRKLSVDGSEFGEESDMVRMDDIDEDLDDPMRRVERRGRKKRRDTDTPVAPKKRVERKVVEKPKKAAAAAEEGESTATVKVESGEDLTESVAAGAEGGEEAVGGDPPAAVRKSPRGSPSKSAAAAAPPQLLTPSKVSGTSRRKAPVTADEDEMEEEEYGMREEIIDEDPEELVEEDLVDVETFEAAPPPMMRGGGGGMGGGVMARLHNKPFRCAECGASYRREAYLLNHLAQVHQDECAILSAAERSAKKAEKRPERMVPKERPGEAAYKFGCDLCERRFLRWEGLVVHQKQIHKEVTAAAKEQEKNRDYGAKCPVCLLYFFGNHALSEHVSKMHPDHNRFIFACDICGMGFMHWARVRAHKTQFHNCPVKYTQGYLKKNPEMAKIVEAQRMKKAVERNRAKRMLEKGILTGIGRDYTGLSRNEMSEYMYLMPPQLEPEIDACEVYEDERDDEGEEIVEEEGIIDANEMMNIQMVPLPPSMVRRPQLPPRMMGYREEYRAYSHRPHGHHQLSAIHQRVTHLNRQDLEILNRRMPPGVGSMKEEEEMGEVDVEGGEREEELIEEEIVDDDLVMEEEEGHHEERQEEEDHQQREQEEQEQEQPQLEPEEEEAADDDQLPPELDMYA